MGGACSRRCGSKFPPFFDTDRPIAVRPRDFAPKREINMAYKCCTEAVSFGKTTIRGEDPNGIPAGFVPIFESRETGTGASRRVENPEFFRERNGESIIIFRSRWSGEASILFFNSNRFIDKDATSEKLSCDTCTHVYASKLAQVPAAATYIHRMGAGDVGRVIINVRGC